MCNEASYLSTGYGTYGKEVLSRLHNTGKYELAEFATYGTSADPRSRSIPWKWYPNLPNQGDEDAQRIYESKTTNQFGEWKFEETCLAFKPDIVFDIRDHWMFQYQVYSPYRPYYYHILMPTVDAYPQEDIWINDFMQADNILTYTDFGLQTLKKQAGHKIKLVKSAPPGANLSVLSPMPDKHQHKKNMGLGEDSLVIGTVMRNQKRKLYPDLFLAFAKFLETVPKDLARRVLLYCHTSFPDVGWDIPLLLRESGVSHKVYFTYICKHCGYVTASKYMDINVPCRKCGLNSMTFPSPQHGVTIETLSRIYNLFDVYVQYAICEGAGMPQIEAAACGVPIMSVNYSGMEDVVKKLGGTPIDVERWFREAETHRIMALPSNNDFINKVKQFLLKPSPVRESMGRKARELCEKHYNWDNTAKVWEDVFDSYKPRPIEETWHSAPRIFNPEHPDRCPPNLSNEEFVRWLIIHMAREPRLINTYLEQKLVRDLNFGQTYDYMGVPYFSDLSALGVRAKLRNFNRGDCVKELLKFIDNRNLWEKRRMEAVK